MELQVLKTLYEKMLRIRMVEERIVELYPQQEMRCPVHLCIGQEAVAAGVCAHLSPQDYIFSTHRSHGHYVAKGGNLKAMMAELYGKATGCSGGKGGSMHLVDLEAGYMGSAPIVGSTIPIATGAAFGSRLHGDSRVTTVFFGEGSTEEGVFYEAVNFAILKKLPIVFICENNLYSVYSPLSVRQPAGREVYRMVAGLGMESFGGDGNDIEDVYRLAGEAIQKARQGGGPTFLELKTYRWREHCGPNFDNDIGYRAEAEFLEWRKRCPLEKAEKRLHESRISPKELHGMADPIKEWIDEAVAFAKSSPFPQASALLEDVYA